MDLGECVSWNGRTYLISNDRGLGLKRVTIEIRTTVDGRAEAFYSGRLVGLDDIGSTRRLNLKAA